MRLVGWFLVLVCLAGASGCTGDTGCTVCNLDGGPDAGCIACDGGPFNVYAVDARQFPVAGFETVPLFQMQLAPNGNIGIVYVELSADQTSWKPRPDPNIFNYDVLYTEWNNGALVVAPERVTGDYPVQNFVGASLDYQTNGQPAVGLLGWAVQPPGYDGTGGLDAGNGNQAYWFQHTAVVSYRTAGTPGTWTQQTAASNSGQAVCGDPSCDNGTIVGLFPALYIDGAESIIAYRDVHFGSSSGLGDFLNSDLEIAYGGPTSWSHLGLAWAKPGHRLAGSELRPTTDGAHAMRQSQQVPPRRTNDPALIGDIGGNEYNSNGTDVVFFERKSGAWNCPLSLLKAGVDPPNMVTETDPYMAYDGSPTGQGYAVAISDISGSGAALYKNCLPGKDCTSVANWSVFTAVYQGPGSGGFFASVALNPDTHDPWVAYYYCSSNSAQNVNSCTASQRSLQVATSVRGIGQWAPETVDPAGAWQTQMLYLTNPTRLVIGYRDPTTGALKLAVENVP